MKKLTHIYENNQWIQVGEINQYDLDLKINRGSLGKINGISIEDGNDVNLDLCPYIIVEELPEDFDEIEKNKIYILISKTHINLPDGIFDRTNFDEIRFTEDYIAGFFDSGNFDSIFFQESQEQEIVPDDPSTDIPDIPVPDESSTTGWRFGVNSTFPIILGHHEETFGATIFGALPVVEHASDGHYIFHVSNEKQKVGYWKKLNDNTFEVKLNDYLSLADATRLYQPKGSYLTTKQAQQQYLSISAASLIYQQKGNYLTVEQAVRNYQTKGNYLTVEQAVQTYQVAGNYVDVNTQAFYIDASIYDTCATVKLNNKQHTLLSSFTLNAATEEKAGLMAANDKQIIRELRAQVEYLTSRVRNLLCKTPGIFDEYAFDECCYQDTPDDSTLNAVGSLVVYSKDGNNANIKQVYTYRYNTETGLSNTIIATEDDMTNAINALKLSIDTATLLDNNDYVFINEANTNNNVLISDIENNIAPDFKIINNQIYYKNEYGGWSFLTTVDEIHSLNTIDTIEFTVDEDMNLAYSAAAENLTITAEVDEKGYASVFIR